VPLRLVLWILVPCLAGGALGVAFASRPVSQPVARAVAPKMQIVRKTAVPPRRVYRDVHARPGLVSLHGISPDASALLSSTSTAPAAAAAAGPSAPRNVVAFTPQRAFSESAPARSSSTRKAWSS